MYDLLIKHSGKFVESQQVGEEELLEIYKLGLEL